MKSFELKYGCNPNQRPASIYMENGSDLPIEILNGRPGYINFLDAFNSWQLVSELREATGSPAASSFKHVSPTSASVAVKMSDTLKKACFVDDIASLQIKDPIQDGLFLPALLRQQGLLGTPVVLPQLEDAAEPSNPLMHDGTPPKRKTSDSIFSIIRKQLPRPPITPPGPARPPRSLPLNEKVRRALSLEEIGRGKRGLFLLSVRDPDGEYWDEETQIVNLSDLGLVARVWEDGMLLWANTLSSVQPIEGEPSDTRFPANLPHSG